MIQFMSLRSLSVLFALLITITLHAQLLPVHREASHYGIDVSRYQAVINWDRVSRWGNHPIEFAYVKASQGVTLEDPFYERNMEEGRRAGILVGSYHYFSSGGPGADQADYFMKKVASMHQDLIPVVDVEEVNRGWGAIALRRNLHDFMERMESAYGIRPIIYSGLFFYNLYLAEEFSDYMLFLARYSEDEPMPSNGTNWTIWQFTDRGQVDGIRGNVDIDCLNGDYSLEQISLSSQRKGPNLRTYTKPQRKPNALPQDAGLMN